MEKKKTKTLKSVKKIIVQHDNLHQLYLDSKRINDINHVVLL